jgi:hypothetical protein
MSMENNMTAVEWLVQHWKKLQSKGEKMSWNQIIQITELAKAMEKEQIIDAWKNAEGYNDLTNENLAEQYYNETYEVK